MKIANIPEEITLAMIWSWLVAQPDWDVEIDVVDAKA